MALGLHVSQGVRLGAAVPWMGHVPSYRLVGAGGDRGGRLGASAWGPKHPPRTRVPFMCVPAAATARTPDGRPKALARPPRPQRAITPRWRLGRAPQLERRAESSWGALSLAGGHLTPAVP